MSTMTRVVGAVCSAAVAAVVAAPTSVAAPPESERIEVDETFDDEFLLETCGVPATTSVTGFIIERVFTNPDGHLQSVTTISITLESSSEFGSVRGRNAGADVVKSGPDGQVTLSITGHVPGVFAGVLVIDLDTGAVIKEPQFTSGERELERICAVLSGE